jgi:electron transfer flavoprotein alpha subunit
MNKILLVGETQNGLLTKNTIDLWAYAQSFNKDSNLLLFSEPTNEVLQQISGNEHSLVYFFPESSSLLRYSTRAYATAINSALETCQAQSVWFVHSAMGRDLCAFSASLTGAIAETQCIGVEFSDQVCTMTTESFSGKFSLTRTAPIGVFYVLHRFQRLKPV